MLKLLRVEDPVKGISTLEFIGPCHINADIGLIAAESRPDVPSTLAERDGRTPNFTQQEMRPAKQAAGHLNGESSFVTGLTAFPKRNFHRYKVLPQGGDEAVFAPCPVSPTPIEDVVGTWQGRIEDGASSMNGTYGVGGYFTVILFHIHSQLPGLRLTPKPIATAWYGSA